MSKQKITLILIFGALIVSAGIGGASWKTLAGPAKEPLAQYAAAVMQKCAANSYPPTCYDEEIPKLMSRISMEDAFAVTRLVQEKDPRLLYCHVLAHNLSYQEAEKSPNAWKDVVARCPTTECNNGCLHGAMMERFKDEVLTDAQIEQLKPDLADVCEPRGKWHPVEGERSMCYHGLGHLFMFITGADIEKSLKLCEFAADKPGSSHVQTCSQGVFMILYQPLEPEDFALIDGIAPKNLQQRDKLCAGFSGLYWESCMDESWAMFKDQMLNANNPSHLINTQSLINFCGYAKEESTYRKCYEAGLSMSAVVVLIDHDDLPQYEKLCGSLPEKIRSRCFSFGAFRMLQIDPRLSDKALAVCAGADRAGYGDDCYTELAQQGSRIFHPGSSEQKAYCAELPVKWRNQCLVK